jgi:hypothetical protein
MRGGTEIEMVVYLFRQLTTVTLARVFDLGCPFIYMLVYQLRSTR